jgi:hypothetical protein
MWDAGIPDSAHWRALLRQSPRPDAKHCPWFAWERRSWHGP